MRLVVCALLVLSACDGGAGLDTPAITLLPAQTFTMDVNGAYDARLDVFRAIAGDLELRSDGMFTNGFDALSVTSRIATAGAIETLEDVVLPPSFVDPPPFSTTDTAPADVGQGVAVYPGVGCPFVARALEHQRSTTGALEHITLELAHADCRDVEIDVTLTPPQGTCPMNRLQVKGAKLEFAAEAWPLQALFVSDSTVPKIVQRYPRGTHVSITVIGPDGLTPATVTWGGDCGGSTSCELDTNSARAMTAEIAYPLVCIIGP